MVSLTTMRCILSIIFLNLGIFIINIPHYAQSQELTEVYSWKAENIVDAAADHMGMLYVSNEKGIISKYDKKGRPLLSYSGEKISPINSIDVSHTAKIFGFFKDNQSYLILDRFLNPLNEALLNGSLIGYASETAYASDNNLWIFDQSDLSVKKISLINNALQTVISVSMFINTEEWDIRQIEEYQNRLYLYNSNGDVYVFDNLGNYIKSLVIRPSCNFCFKDDYLIYVQDQKILEYGLYNNEIKQIATTGNTNHIIKVISINNFIYLISKSRISVYQ
jgi:hypothetical protein